MRKLKASRQLKQNDELRRLYELITKRLNPKKPPRRKCKHCPRTFAYQRSLSNHLRTHARQTHKCSDCGKVYSNIYKYEAHLIRHTQVTEHVCQICGFAAKCASALQRHGEIHQSQKVQPFSCSFCPRTFRKPWYLNSHQKIHKAQDLESDEGLQTLQKSKSEVVAKDESSAEIEKVLHEVSMKPFNCKMCSARFASQHDYRYHMRMTHNNALRWTCGICHGKFTGGRKLGAHILKYHNFDSKKLQVDAAQEARDENSAEVIDLTMTTYNCDLCGKECQDAHSLDEHVQGNHGTCQDGIQMKIITCPFCDCDFISEDEFGEHVRIHTKEKPWEV